ncbi:MAG: hypothetical protein L6E13_12555 [Firmicutes bacterium]|nr:hypothetical protein [Bacillota bacterium]
MERLLDRDWVVRLLSVLLAFILWLNVTSDRVTTATRIYQLPVTVENLGEDLQVLPPERPMVEVSLTGPKPELDRIREEDLQPYVDATGLEPGYYPLPVKLRARLPAGVTARLSPDVVYLRIERYVAKEVPVVLPQPEIYQDEVKYVLELQVKTATLSGQQSLVDRVARVEARADVTGAQSGEVRQAHLVALDSTGNEVTGIGITPATVPVKVTVVQLPPAKAVPVRPRFTGALPEGYTYSVTVSPATVLVRGPRDRHPKWTEVVTEPIDLTGQTRSFIYQVGLVKPEGAESMDAQVATVTVHITEEVTERTFRDLPVGIWHLGPGLQAELAVDRATVRVRGPRRVLDQFDPASFALRVEARDLGPGRHLLPVRYNRPEEVQVLAVEPAAVEVTVSQVPESPPGNPDGAG